MVPLNHSNFQYCDSNIGLFSIAHCKFITLNPLCILFGITSLITIDVVIVGRAITMYMGSNTKKNQSTKLIQKFKQKD